MSNYTQDDRERTPKEQAGSFIASIGGLLGKGKEESAIASDLADLLIRIASTKNAPGVAVACSRAMGEWADVNRASPDHAYDLALMASRTAKNLPSPPEAVQRLRQLGETPRPPIGATPRRARVATPKAGAR